MTGEPAISGHNVEGGHEGVLISTPRSVKNATRDHDLLGCVVRIFLFTLAVVSVAATPADVPLDIEAGHLEVLPGQGEARFSMGVVVRQANFTLRCASIVARYDKKNRVETLEASGDVRVEADGWSAVAERARYERATETLSLTGQPTLSREKDVLHGERIVFWLAEERMVVEKVRGRITAPRLSKLAPGPL